MFNKNTLVVSTIAILSLTSCAHRSVVPPSTGHIDGAGSTPQADQAMNKADIPKPVKSNVYLPPPKPRAKEQTYSVVVNEVPVKEILFALARESKLNVDIHPSIQGRVTLNAVDQTLPAILERLAKQVDLTYKIEGNVLSIGPDLPVLRNYKVDYVNMSRDTTGFIGVAAEIASTGRSATTTGAGAAGGAAATGSTSSAAGSTGGPSTNSSRTQVQSLSKHHFWESLVQNIKDILAETDKEVLITRSGSSSQTDTTRNAQQSADNTSPENPVPVTQASIAQEREEARTEYRTLFAATVIANAETGIISVRGNSKQHEKVQEFLDKVMSSAKRQVLIEATIVEVRLNDNFQAGIDWSRLGNGFSFTQALGLNSVLSATSATTSLAGTNTPFNIGYASNGTLGDLNASIRLLRQFGETKVLSSPKLMVLNNQTAVLKVVDNLVYFIVSGQTNANQTNTQTTFTSTPQTVPIGVVMSVTPQINDGSSVMLNVRPTISRRITDVQDPNPSLVITSPGGATQRIESRIPVIQIREMESLLKIDSGNTAILGGLMQDEIQQATDKVPEISKIPIFGKLFTAKSNFNVKTELVIFLRPTVISTASLESDELQSYKRFLPEQQLNRSLEGNGY